MATFTLIPKPSSSVVTLVYNDTTVTGVGEQVIEVDTGTVVNWSVSAGSQFKDATGTKTVTANYTETVSLETKGSVIGDTIVPASGADEFPTHFSNFGKGGWHQVDYIEQRDLIPAVRLYTGMGVYVTSESKLYILQEFDPTTTPITKTWVEFKSGNGGDAIRKTTTFNNFVPLDNGEIVQYVGETNQDYIHGYFYKAIPHFAYSNIQFTPSGDYEIEVSISDEDLTTFFNEEFIPTDSPFVSGQFGYRQTDPEVLWSFSPETETHEFRSHLGTPEQYAESGFTVTPPIGPSQGLTFTVDHAITYTWEQINVQPVIDNVTSTSTTAALSANMGRALQEEIDAISGRGRYLSNWNCKTGLPTTEPETLPYELHSGDYYIVNETYTNPGPESCVISQIAGTLLEELSVDMSDYKTKVNPEADKEDYFTYTDKKTDSSDTHGDEKLIIIDQTKFDSVWNSLIETAIEEHPSYATPISIIHMEIYFYAYNTLNINVRLNAATESGSMTYNLDTLSHSFPITESMTYEEQQQIVIDTLLTEFGIKVIGLPYIPQSPAQNESWKFLPETSAWYYNGDELDDGDTLEDYGITYSGDETIGVVLRVNYFTEKYNYKPDVEYVDAKPVYNGHKSEVIETNVVKPNDTYIFDGSIWILFKNTVFIDDHLSLVSENAVQNKVITAELNKRSGVIFRDFEPEEEL